MNGMADCQFRGAFHPDGSRLPDGASRTCHALAVIHPCCRDGGDRSGRGSHSSRTVDPGALGEPLPAGVSSNSATALVYWKTRSFLGAVVVGMLVFIALRLIMGAVLRLLAEGLACARLMLGHARPRCPRSRSAERTTIVARVRPFNAYTYARTQCDIRVLTAPPYDVVSDEQRESLLAGNPHNIVARSSRGSTRHGDPGNLVTRPVLGGGTSCAPTNLVRDESPMV